LYDKKQEDPTVDVASVLALNKRVWQEESLRFT